MEKLTKSQKQEIFNARKEDEQTNNTLLITEALGIIDRMAKDKERLQEIKDYFEPLLTGNKTTNKFITTVGIVERKVSNEYSIAPEYYPKLKGIFNESISDFIAEKPKYSPTALYKAYLKDKEYEHRQLIIDAVVIKQSKTITFEPVKNK